MAKVIGSTAISKILTQKDIDEFVKTLGLSSSTLIIKPNWVTALPGTYTDAKILDMFLTSVGKPVIFVEGYTFWRNDKYTVGGGDYFSSGESTLETGKNHWDHFKKQDEWFLTTTGIGEVLKKHQAQYLNITNEFWVGNIADPEEIKSLIEAKFDPVDFKELYSYIPKHLFDLKGYDFISFAKAKKGKEYAFTLSTKNLFGLIPDPTRYPKYHGENDELLAQNIADINKIYRSLFNCSFVVEGVFTASRAKSMTEVMAIEDWGVILGGKNSIEVDMIAAKLLKANLAKAETDTLVVSRKVFGDFDYSILPQIPQDLEINYE